MLTTFFFFLHQFKDQVCSILEYLASSSLEVLEVSKDVGEAPVALRDKKLIWIIQRNV